MAEKQDIEFNRNEDFNKLTRSEQSKKLRQIHLGGGEKRIADQKAKGVRRWRRCHR